MAFILVGDLFLPVSALLWGWEISGYSPIGWGSLAERFFDSVFDFCNTDWLYGCDRRDDLWTGYGGRNVGSLWEGHGKGWEE